MTCTCGAKHPGLRALAQHRAQDHGDRKLLDKLAELKRMKLQPESVPLRSYYARWEFPIGKTERRAPE